MVCTGVAILRGGGSWRRSPLVSHGAGSVHAEVTKTPPLPALPPFIASGTKTVMTLLIPPPPSLTSITSNSPLFGCRRRKRRCFGPTRPSRAHILPLHTVTVFSTEAAEGGKGVKGGVLTATTRHAVRPSASAF
jgi:hypothetical protein